MVIESAIGNSESSADAFAYAELRDEVDSPVSWRLLDQVGCSLCILDASLRLLYSNAIAEQTIRRRWFGTDRTFRASTLEPVTLQLRSAFSACLAGRPALVQSFDAGRLNLLAVSPVRLQKHNRAILMTSEAVDIPSSPVFRMYARTLGLTRKETQVLEELSRGLDPKRVALTLEVSIETIRSHIKSILCKASAGTLRELLLRLAKLPPVMVHS